MPKNNGFHLFFSDSTNQINLMVMNADMHLSEFKVLIKLPPLRCIFYGMDNGSIVFSSENIVHGSTNYYRIAIS